MLNEVVEIVAAYVRKNTIAASELPGVITQVNQALDALGQNVINAERLTPAVPIKRAVGAATVTCLDCGFEAQMLRPHLTRVHGLTADEYRARWGLRSDFPMVARNYSARRSEMAKALGLGRRAKRVPVRLGRSEAGIPPLA